MNPQTPQVGGAEAPERQVDPVLRDVVADLIHLSTTEQNRLNSHGVSQQCLELLDYTNNPARKPQHTVQDVVCEIVLIL